MKHNLIISLLCILLLAGCKSESQRLKSPTGYEYQVIHTDKSKPTVPLDSYVFFNMKLMQKDSVITSTEMIGEPSILKVMADNASYGKLEGMVDGNKGCRLFCLPPTRLTGPCRRGLLRIMNHDY